MRRFAIGFALALVAAACWAGAALADATPTELVLSYLPRVSNTGTSHASGIAELVMLEGEVRISATGLPHLDGDDRYVVWLLNTDSNDFLRLGAFNADADGGTVHYEQVLPDAIPDKHWNLLLLTVEHEAAPAEPGSQHSLAATFPLPDDTPLPAMLPNTGGAPDDAPTGQAGRPDWLPEAGLATLTALVGAAAGYVTGKRA